jgi:hypothetical protein
MNFAPIPFALFLVAMSTAAAEPRTAHYGGVQFRIPDQWELETESAGASVQPKNATGSFFTITPVPDAGIVPSIIDGVGDVYGLSDYRRTKPKAHRLNGLRAETVVIEGTRDGSAVVARFTTLELKEGRLVLLSATQFAYPADQQVLDSIWASIEPSAAKSEPVVNTRIGKSPYPLTSNEEARQAAVLYATLPKWGPALFQQMHADQEASSCPPKKEPKHRHCTAKSGVTYGGWTRVAVGERKDETALELHGLYIGNKDRGLYLDGVVSFDRDLTMTSALLTFSNSKRTNPKPIVVVGALVFRKSGVVEAGVITERENEASMDAVPTGNTFSWRADKKIKVSVERDCQILTVAGRRLDKVCASDIVKLLPIAGTFTMTSKALTWLNSAREGNEPSVEFASDAVNPWRLIKSTDKPAVVRAADNTITTSDRMEEEKPSLYVGCINNGPAIMIGIDSDMETSEREFRQGNAVGTKIEYRLDGETPRSQWLRVSKGMLRFEDDKQVLKQLLEHEVLSVDVTVRGGKPQTVKFALTGLRRALGEVGTSCH